MEIKFGSKSKEIASKIIEEACPNCGTQHSVSLFVFQKYAHVFWIPMFSIGRTGVSRCSNCKQLLTFKEMPPSFVTAYKGISTIAKTPLWMFSGLALLAVLIIFVVFAGNYQEEKNARLISAPKSGDIFEIKTTENQYTLYKIDQVVGDSVFVFENNYETNKLRGLDDLKLKGAKAYSEDVYGFSKDNLKQMLENGEIIDIDRY